MFRQSSQKTARDPIITKIDKFTIILPAHCCRGGLYCCRGGLFCCRGGLFCCRESLFLVMMKFVIISVNRIYSVTTILEILNQSIRDSAKSVSEPAM